MLEDKYTIAVLNWTGWIDHHGCATVSRRLSTELLARRFAVSVVPIGKNWEAYRKDLSKVSCVVINGEGTLHDSSLLGLGLLEIVDFCRPLGIPVFLINASWHNNDETHYKYARRLTGIFVRDSASAREVASGGIASKIVPDLTFGIDTSIISGLNQRGPSRREGLIFTDSIRASVSNDLGRAAVGVGSMLTMESGQPVKSFLDGLSGVSDLAAKDSLLRKARWYPYRELIRGIVKRLSGELDRPRDAEGLRLPFVDFLARLSSSGLVVAGRYHAVCFCITTKTPFAAIPSNSPKIEALLEDAGLKIRLIKETSQLKELPDWTNENDDLCSSYVGFAKVRQSQMFDEIAQSARK